MIKIDRPTTTWHAAAAWGAAIAVAQWLLVYLAHQPMVAISGWPLGVATVAVAIVGGFASAVDGRSGRALRAGCFAGLAVGVIQLLVVGWDPAPGGFSVLVWAPASLVFWCAVGGFGGWLATRRGANIEALARSLAMPPRPVAAIAAILSTVLLLAASAPVVDPSGASSAPGFVRPLGDWLAGGLGLHVQDWLERLAGAAVLVFAISLGRLEASWVRVVGWTAVALWVSSSTAGGWLGRELGTSSFFGHDTSWQWVVRPASAVLVMVALSAVAWTDRGEARARASGYDIALAAVALLLVGSQATLGLALRARSELLLFHLLFGVAVVLPVMVHLAIRGWLEAEHDGPRRRACMAAGALMVAQLGLGILAYSVPRSVDLGAATGVVDLGLSSVHLWLAAALVLGTARILVLSLATAPR